MNKKKQTVKSDSLFLFAKNLRNLNAFVEKSQINNTCKNETTFL